MGAGRKWVLLWLLVAVLSLGVVATYAWVIATSA